MRFHDKLKQQVYLILENQLHENNPPETREALERLIRQGYEEPESKQLIWKCLVIEINDSMNNNRFFNEQRYIKNLKKLPIEPKTEE